MKTKTSQLMTYSVAVLVSGMVNSALLYGFVASDAAQSTAEGPMAASGLIASQANLPAADLVARITVVGKRPATATLADSSATPAARPIAPAAQSPATDCLERVVVVGHRPAALQRVVVNGMRPVASNSSYGTGSLSAPQPSTP